MRYLALLLGAIALRISGFSIRHKPCDGTQETAEVTSIDISPCAQDPCRLKKGSTYNVSVSFTTGASPAGTKGLEAQAFGKVGAWVPIPGFNQTDACKKCNLECPLQPHTQQVYRLPLYLNPEEIPFVPLDVEVKTEINDLATGTAMLCQLCEVQVVG